MAEPYVRQGGIPYYRQGESPSGGKGGVVKTGKSAFLQVTHGGQYEVITGHNHTAAVKGEDGLWRRNNRNGSMTKMPDWTDDHALAHGEKRHAQDAKKSGHQPVQQGVFHDRRNQQLYPPALKKF